MTLKKHKFKAIIDHVNCFIYVIWFSTHLNVGKVYQFALQENSAAVTMSRSISSTDIFFFLKFSHAVIIPM